MKEQLLQFRELLTNNGLTSDDFEMNVDGETFRLLMAGKPAEIKVHCRSSQVTRTYSCDGSPRWLEQFSADLEASLFLTDPA